MQLNALHMRFAAIAVGIVIVGGYFMCGGSDGTIVQIDFSIDPDWLAGAAVEIDGKIVGKLALVGGAARNGFEVRKGSHRVRVVHEEMDCEPLELTLNKPGQKARLILDVTERYDERSGSSKTMLYFMQ
jgi:hypothetical protein